MAYPRALLTKARSRPCARAHVIVPTRRGYWDGDVWRSNHAPLPPPFDLADHVDPEQPISAKLYLHLRFIEATSPGGLPLHWVEQHIAIRCPICCATLLGGANAERWSSYAWCDRFTSHENFATYDQWRERLSGFGDAHAPGSHVRYEGDVYVVRADDASIAKPYRWQPGMASFDA